VLLEGKLCKEQIGRPIVHLWSVSGLFRRCLAFIILHRPWTTRRRNHHATSARRENRAEHLLSLSLSHLLNDTIQSLLPRSIRCSRIASPELRQIGLITFTFQLTASCSSRWSVSHRPASQAVLARHWHGCDPGWPDCAVAGDKFPRHPGRRRLVGTGSSVFHPEASRVARLASAPHGFAHRCSRWRQFWQFARALLAAAIVVPRGQRASCGSRWWRSPVSWCCSGGPLVSRRYGKRQDDRAAVPTCLRWFHHARFGRALVFVALIFSKYIYLVSLTSYYTFFLIGKFACRCGRADAIVRLHFCGSRRPILGGTAGDRFAASA